MTLSCPLRCTCSILNYKTIDLVKILEFSILETCEFLEISTNIHTSAIIEKGAIVGKNCTVGPFCYLGSEVPKDLGGLEARMLGVKEARRPGG